MAESQKNQSKTREQVRSVRITERHDGQRLDNFLIRELKGVPRTRIYRIIRRGEVRVNKKRCKPDFKLSVGDEVRIPPVREGKRSIPSKISPAIAELLQSSVLLETDLLLVINKPAGLSVHGGSGVRLGIIEALRQMKQEWRHAELAHRLDRDTSGCLIIAKKANALKQIQDEFKGKRVEKIYHALVHGQWPEEIVEISAPLRKNQLSSGERIVQVSADGKSAETRFTVLERYAMASLLEVSPTTGRTHQIRVHCQYAGYPILGDQKYGPKSMQNELKPIKKLCLHAAKIRFSDPASDGWLEVEALGIKSSEALNLNYDLYI
ncbi:MAG: RluA family pseudouridine synthase [Pseudomonadales bacterium]|nr:RluA family pseudouridine synthase [Pseudomonadales bacterium]